MSSSQQDTPLLCRQEKIRKERLLTVLKAKVVLLREQLETAENECKTLEAELARNLSPVTYPRVSIRNLPTETLLEIFALSILERHGNIGNLLFVCEQWNTIIMNNPHLWDTISITFTLQKSNLDKELAYCTDCIERSGDKLLTISINAKNLCEEILSLAPWRLEYDARIESLWKSLKIHDDAFLKRFKSLHIDLPHSHIDYSILSPLFTCHFPNLICLSLPHFDSDDTFRQFLIKTPVTILTTGNGPVMNVLGSSLKALKALDCYVYESLDNLPSTSSLESLTLRRSRYWPRLGNVIMLPCLRTLTVVGVWPDEILSRLEVPALSHLTFVTYDNVNFSSKLTARPLEIHWELGSPNLLPQINNHFISIIGQLFCQYDSVKTMKVPSCATNIVLGAFKSLANQEVVSVELLGTRVLDDDSVLLEMDISTGSS